MDSSLFPPEIAETIGVLASGDRDAQGRCFEVLVTSLTPDTAWADAAWRQIVPLLRHSDNRVRSISGQALCALAPAASWKLISRDLEAFLNATHDEHFVTARHVLLALWQLGTGDARLRAMLTARLCERFKSCESERNATLIRYDIQCVLRRLADATADESIMVAADSLIEIETDPKYQKKYAGVWRAKKP
jgi:hypothetical protein